MGGGRGGTPHEVKIKRFDPSVIPDDATIVAIGGRGSGKTTAIADILFHKRSIPSGICMSNTEAYNGFWSPHIPSTFIYPDFDEDAIKAVLRHQRRLAPPGKPRPAAFVFAEDVM